MKRCIAALVCLVLLATAVPALADAPNMRQSMNYFMNYFNEAVVQAIQSIGDSIVRSMMRRRG